MDSVDFLEKEFDTNLPEWRTIVPFPEMYPLEIVINDNQNLLISWDRKKQIIQTTKGICDKFNQKLTQLSTWINVFQNIIETRTLFIITFGIIYAELTDLGNKSLWATIWERSMEILPSKDNLLMEKKLSDWFKQISKPKELNKIYEIIRVALRAHFKLNTTIIQHYLLNKQNISVLELAEKVLVAMYYILNIQTDNTSRLYETVTTSPYSKTFSTYGSLNRVINKIFEDEYIQSSYVLNSSFFNLRYWHMIIFESTIYPELESNYKKSSCVLENTGYGSGFGIYNQYLMSRVDSIDEDWRIKDLQLVEKHIDSLLLYSDTDPIYYFSGEFYTNHDLKHFFDPLRLQEIIQEVIHTHDYYPDISFEAELQNSSILPLDVSTDVEAHDPSSLSNTFTEIDIKLLNAILETNSESSPDIARSLHLDNNLVSNHLNFLKDKHAFKQFFTPAPLLFSETTILFINAPLLKFEKLDLFLKRLPYTKVQEARGIGNHELWRIITIYTPSGMADTILQSILQNFDLDTVKILRIHNSRSHKWHFPINL